MKKKLILLTDIPTIILLLIQVQSTIVFFIENFAYIKNYIWTDYFYLYGLHGISSIIVRSSYEKLYIGVVFIVFCLNLYAIAVKLIDLYQKKLIYGLYKLFILLNIAFVCAKVLEFNEFLNMAMGI